MEAARKRSLPRVLGAVGVLCALCGVVAWSSYGCASEAARASSLALYVQHAALPKVPQMLNDGQTPQAPVPSAPHVPQSPSSLHVPQVEVGDTLEMPHIAEVPFAQVSSVLVGQAQPERPYELAQPIMEEPANPFSFLGGFAGGLAAGATLVYSFVRRSGQKVSIEVKNRE